MAAKIFALVCSFAVFNSISAQVIKLPYSNVLPIDLVPNQVYVNSPVLPCGVDSILSAPVTVPATTTIIQDSTVANNLANALQLLVVSNLLSNTLPSFGPDVVVPYAPSIVDVVSPLPCGLPGVSYAPSYVDVVSPLPCGLPNYLPGYSYIF